MKNLIKINLQTFAGFDLMNAHLFEINIAPPGETENFVRLAQGFNNADPQNNEEIAQDNYFDGDGFGESDVIGAQLTIALSGHRYYGNAAQDYIFGRSLELGPARRTTFKWTQPDGSMFTGSCTIANISGPSGDAGAKGDISCEIHFNGKPTYTPATGLVAPTLNASIYGSDVALEWTSVPGATGYVVYRNNILLTTVSSASTVSYTDTNATANETYTYKVAAKNGNTEGPFSSNVSITVIPGP